MTNHSIQLQSVPKTCFKTKSQEPTL